jgi:hypothetical protein
MGDCFTAKAQRKHKGAKVSKIFQHWVESSAHPLGEEGFIETMMKSLSSLRLCAFAVNTIR